MVRCLEGWKTCDGGAGWWLSHSQVSSYDVLQDGTLTARLTTNDDDLREIDRVGDANRCEDILKLVHEAEGQRIVSFQSASRGREVLLGVTYVIKAGSEIPPWLEAGGALIVAMRRGALGRCCGRVLGRGQGRVEDRLLCRE